MHELRLLCPEDRVELLSDALEALDALSVSVEDADAQTDAEQALFGEPGLPPPKEGWQRSRVIALFADEALAQSAAVTLQPQDFFAGCTPIGVVQVPEGRAILTTLTVLENLQLGAYSRKDVAGIAGSLEEIFELFPRLKDRSMQYAGNLSGGEQQMLAIGRALMAKPKLLLLDEPSMGLAPIMAQEIFRTLVKINAAGLSVLLVEQNVRQALKIARHGFVIETGKIVLADTGANLLFDPRVQAAYLGG